VLVQMRKKVWRAVECKQGERQGRAGRQGVLGGVQGAESLFLWRAIGGAVLTLVPATAYSLKVGRALP